MRSLRSQTHNLQNNPVFRDRLRLRKEHYQSRCPPEADCPTVYVGTDLPIEEVGKAAQAITKEMVQMVADRLKLPVTDKKVLSATRSLLTSGVQG